MKVDHNRIALNRYQCRHVQGFPEPRMSDFTQPRFALGTPMIRHKVICRHFEPALKAAGIEAIRWHDLRHTFASLLLEQGENVKYIQNQLGHASPTMTLNVYSHLLKETNQEVVCRLENAIFQATGHKMVINWEKRINGEKVRIENLLIFQKRFSSIALMGQSRYSDLTSEVLSANTCSDVNHATKVAHLYDERAVCIAGGAG